MSFSSIENRSGRQWLDQETLLQSIKDGLRARLKVILGLTLLTFALTALLTWLTEPTYVSAANLLLKKERVDAPVTPEQTLITSPEHILTEEEINSEVEVLRSPSLLAEVVERLHLEKEFERRAGLLSRVGSLLGNPPLSAPARAQVKLEREISIDPVKKSNVIRVSYQANNPEFAARVVNTLCKVYQERHAQLSRPEHGGNFFAEQANAARAKLDEKDAALRRVSPLPNTQLTTQQIETQLRQLNEFEAALRNTRTALAESEARIRTITAQLQTEPARLVSEERVTHRTAPEAIRSQLFALELKRTELLTKYQPSHRLVQDVERDLAQARRLVEQAEAAPAETMSVTSLNTLRQRLTESLAAERSTLASLREKERYLAGNVGEYAARIKQMGERGYEQRRLERERELADNAYQLYSKKGEEGRLSEELDKQGIVNVRVAEAARPAFKPISPNVPLNLAMGLIGGLILGLAAAYVLEYFNPSSRLQKELALSIPLQSYRVESR